MENCGSRMMKGEGGTDEGLAPKEEKVDGTFVNRRMAAKEPL
jgi:hypothetical protein